MAGRTRLAALSAVADLLAMLAVLAVLDVRAVAAGPVPAALTVLDAVGLPACQALVVEALALLAGVALVVAALAVAEVDGLTVSALLELAVTLSATDPEVCGPGDGSVLGLGDPGLPWTDGLVPDDVALVEPGGGGELLPEVALTLEDALLGGDVLSVGVTLALGVALVDVEVSVGVGVGVGVAVSVGVALVDVAEPVGEALVGGGVGEGLFDGGGVVRDGDGEGEGLGDARCSGSHCWATPLTTPGVGPTAAATAGDAVESAAVAATENPAAVAIRTLPVTRLTPTGRTCAKRIRGPASAVRCFCGTTYPVWSGYIRRVRPARPVRDYWTPSLVRGATAIPTQWAPS